MTTPGLRFGRYEVGERVGKGSFGVVHLARDVELGRELVIKFLRSEYLALQQIVQRFLQEARAAAKIGHPGIVTVFECGLVANTGTRIDGTAFIAMERLIGECLSDRIKHVRPSIATAIAITRQLATTLGAAHAAGIVHRDMKPDNVFLIRDSAVVGGDRVKILDFGVAKLLEPSSDGPHTNTQVVLGTPTYMAPEQARSAARVDRRSDIYALGCILYELVCGRPPFGGDIGDVLAKHQADRPPPPRERAPGIPHALDALLLRMLEKRPDDRPQTMAEVESVLAQVTTVDEPDVIVGRQATRASGPLAKHARDEPVTQTPGDEVTVRRPRRARSRSTMPVLAALGAAGVAGLVTYFVLRRDPEPPARAAAAPADARAPAADAAELAPDTALVAPTNPERDRIHFACIEQRDARRWVDLADCAAKLAPHDAATADQLATTARTETGAEAAHRRVMAAIDKGDLAAARQSLAGVDARSVYRPDAEAALVRAEPKPKPACDVKGATARGQPLYDRSDFAGALAAFEVGLACSTDGVLVLRAYMAACRARDADKARAYFARLPANRRAQASQVCAQENIELGDCDPAAAAARGTDAFERGNHAAALAAYEEAQRCRVDPKLYVKMFLMACKTRDEKKARLYFSKLGSQDSIVQSCIREGIDPRRP